MAFMKRATASALAMVLVVGILAGVHGLVHAVHRRSGVMALSGTKIRLSHSQLGTKKKRSEEISKGKRSESLNGPSSPIGSLGDGTAPDENCPFTCQLTGGIGLAGGGSRPAPMRLPASTNAVPLPPASDDWPVTADPPQQDVPVCKPKPSGSRQPASSGRRIIDRELPDSTTEERDVWHESTKELPLHDLRELLRLRTELGRLSPPFLDKRQTQIKPPVRQPAEAWPPNSAPNDGNALPAREPDPQRVLSESFAAIERARHVILNNIANAQSNGYKRGLLAFESATLRRIIPSLGDGSVPIAFGDPLDAGARLASVVPDMTAGRLVRTNRSLDLAIDGQGFFHVAEPLKKRDGYTRRGRFTTNAAGQLILRSANGEWILQPAITIPADSADIEVGGDGQVRGWDSRSQTLVSLGSIETACFASPAALVATEGTFFVPRGAMKADRQSPGAKGHGPLRQGCLEESNVDVKQELEELARLSGQSQALEQAARMIRSVDALPAGTSAPVSADRDGRP